MSDMVERVARAMWFDFVMNDGFPSPHPTWGELKEDSGQKLLARSNARAAIEAMMEPTDDMIATVIHQYKAPRVAKPTVVGIYQKMVAAALKETQ